jgi:hypothetical protein
MYWYRLQIKWGYKKSLTVTFVPRDETVNACGSVASVLLVPGGEQKHALAVFPQSLSLLCYQRSKQPFVHKVPILI